MTSRKEQAIAIYETQVFVTGILDCVQQATQSISQGMAEFNALLEQAKKFPPSSDVLMRTQNQLAWCANSCICVQNAQSVSRV